MTSARPLRILGWVRSSAGRIRRRPQVRELLIFAGFVLLTSLMTWPWVLHLRNAVADRGDPYMIAWTLWWDYHQTFHNPLELFNANIFYPLKYTLAFSEHDYGIALFFFPLFAAGLKPLTIHSIATFLGFAFSGYGAFRLTRTLTGRTGPAWIAGIVFAFIPFRFHLLSHLHYLFSGWIPLLLESLVLFARKSSWRRASWMGTAFLMNALTCISWLIMTVVPLAATVLFLLTVHKSLWRSREFWLRGALAIGLATLVLFPFLWPYFRVSALYGLKWQPWEFAFNSPSLIHWFKAETRNQIWQNFGAAIPGGHRLFPGMLAPLLAAVSLGVGNQFRSRSRIKRRLGLLLNFVILAAAVVALLAIGYGDHTYRLFGLRLVRLNDRSVSEALFFVIIGLGLKLWLLLPAFIRRLRRRRNVAGESNETNSPANIEAVGVGVVWAVLGFLGSLGANVFFNRWLHDYFFLYKSIRIPSRAAMVCYLGLAVLAGIGAARLARHAQRFFSYRRVEAITMVFIASVVLVELHASPMHFETGEVEPTALALRLKQTQMKGGLVELPSGVGENRHFYMLRAADHGRPLVNATSSFISPFTDKINRATEGKISPDFMDLLEQIPASYLVVHNDRLIPGWQSEYELFLQRSIVSGRLRFVNRFDGHDDLYAVVKTEPEVKGEAQLPFALKLHEWAALISNDPVNMLGRHHEWMQTLYRIHLLSTETLPRYKEFLEDAKQISAGVVLGDEDQRQLEQNLRDFAATWIDRTVFKSKFDQLNDESYVDQLFRNAGVPPDQRERHTLSQSLSQGQLNRAEVLLRVVQNERFTRKEHYRSLVVLHYFGYLRRNPDDLPDGNLNGMRYWLNAVERSGDISRLSLAFKASFEYEKLHPKK